MYLEDWKNFIAFTASISTILQFLSGTLICQKYVQKGTTGDTSGFPFVCGFLSCSLWLRYGFLIQEHSIILVNTIGSTLHLAYVVTFYAYSIKKSTIIRQFSLILFTLITCLIYSQYETDLEEAKIHMGITCCIMTIIFFAAPLASLMHVIKVKSSESLPFPIILSTFVVSLLWFLYGIIINDKFVQVPNFMGCILCGFQLSLFVWFPRLPPSPSYTA